MNVCISQGIKLFAAAGVTVGVALAPMSSDAIDVYDGVGAAGIDSAAVQASEHFARGEVIQAAELEQMRAGFNIGGLDVDFGARLRTSIDDGVELLSVINFTRHGAEVVSRTLNNLNGTSSSTSSVPSSLVGPGTGININDIAPEGMDLSGLSNFNGIAIQDHKGFTAALHEITRKAIMSGVVSNSNGRSIKQRVDVEVRLNNVGELQAAQQRAAIMESFSGLLR